MIGLDSRWNYSTRIRVIKIDGTLAENERMDMPIPRVPLQKKARPDIQTYTVRDGDTWSGVAHRFLRGRSDLWWVIAEYTGVIDPFREFYTGKVLNIPTFTDVAFGVLAFDKTQVPVPNFPDEIE